MVWQDQHDLLLLREILAQEPWKFKQGSVERGKCWDLIADTLNTLEDTGFRVDKRSVRDRFGLLRSKYDKKIKDEEKASGISPEPTEVDDAMCDILKRFEEAEEDHQKEQEEKNRKETENVQQAQDMRRTSMERLGETSKRNEERKQKDKKRKRSDGTETLSFIKEKAMRDGEYKEKDLELRKQELDLQKGQQRIITAQMQQMAQMNAAFMQQQQQQNALLLGLIDKLSNK